MDKLSELATEKKSEIEELNASLLNLKDKAKGSYADMKGKIDEAKKKLNAYKAELDTLKVKSTKYHGVMEQIESKLFYIAVLI